MLVIGIFSAPHSSAQEKIVDIKEKKELKRLKKNYSGSFLRFLSQADSKPTQLGAGVCPAWEEEGRAALGKVPTCAEPAAWSRPCTQGMELDSGVDSGRCWSSPSVQNSADPVDQKER